MLFAGFFVGTGIVLKIVRPGVADGLGLIVSSRVGVDGFWRGVTHRMSTQRRHHAIVIAVNIAVGREAPVVRRRAP